MQFNLKSLLLWVTLACITAAVVGTRGWMGVYYAWWFWAAVAGVAAYRSTRGSFAVLAMAMFLGGLLVLPIAFMEGHPVSLARLRQVRPGMTERQVEQALGMPTSIDGYNWVYASDWTWCYITIVFSDGHVAEVVHDH